jgi:predicted nucleic acid-binding protein
MPRWLSVSSAIESDDPDTQALDSGERSVIALAESMGAGLILMDERKGTRTCIQKGIPAIGTLGLLDRAARRGMVDLADAFVKLKATNFRYRPQAMDAILAKFLADTRAADLT